MSFPRFSLSSFVTLFSFQGTIFYIDFKFKQVCVQFAFSSTSSRTSVRKTEKKCEMCVKLFELVEMRRIELLTPCLQGRCSPSWATPPNLVDTSLLTNIKSLVIFRMFSNTPTYGWHHIRLCASLLRQLCCLSLRFASRFHTGTLIRCFALLRNASGGPKWTRTTDLTLIRRAL